MSIQSNLNQSLTILGALATQSPELKQMSENRRLQKQYDTVNELMDKAQTQTQNKLQTNKMLQLTRKGDIDYPELNARRSNLNVAEESYADLTELGQKAKELGLQLGEDQYTSALGRIKENKGLGEGIKSERTSLAQENASLQRNMKAQLENQLKEAENNALSSLKAKSSSRTRQKERLNLMRNNVKDRAVRKQNKLNDIRARKDIRAGKGGTE